MTGETEKGTSIRVVRKLLPAKSNFEIAHAAAMPKITFNGTAIAATSNVSRIADSASGSSSAFHACVKPWVNASENTVRRGSRRKDATNPHDSRISAMGMAGSSQH